MKRLLYFFPLLLTLNGCFYIPLSSLTEEAQVETPKISEPDNYFLAAIDVYDEGKPLSSDPKSKGVIVLVEVENGDPKQVSFNGFFSLHMAKIGNKLGIYHDVVLYSEGEKDSIDPTLKRDVFSQAPPFEGGEKRRISLAFSVPKNFKPTKVYIPTQDGGRYLDL